MPVGQLVPARLPAVPPAPVHRGKPMNICARCDQPILHGEVYDRVDMHANSGGQFDVLRHLVCPGRTTDRAPAGSPRTGRAAP
ncbi:hypothetical protein P405_30215 [Streptomyces sp. FR-008]|nr:hypothetical protein P405_30215 [Streptomyces sp. FR-008]